MSRPAPSPRRTLPLFQIVTAGLGAAVLAVVGYAVYRHLSSPSSPILPVSWCRTTMTGSLPPLLGTPLLTYWHVDPIADVVVGLMTALYLGGVVAARRQGTSWPKLRIVSFLAGMVVCVLATNSSIAVYDMALFTAHMIGHLMLVMLAPALIAASRPISLLIAATAQPRRGRIERAVAGRVVGLITAPPVALACYAAIIVGTHLTGLMDTIMQSPWAGQVEHLAYLVIGLQFFTVVLGGEPIRWQLTTPARWLLLGIAMAVDTFVGVILLIGDHPIAMMSVPGLTVNTLSDTHTGGAIMWVGGDGLMALVMILLVRDWITDAERRRTDRSGWMEQVRQQVFAANTGTEYTGAADGLGGADPDFDDDEAALDAYNRYLQRINQTHPG